MNPVALYFDRLSGQYDAITATTGRWTSPRKIGALIRERGRPGLAWLVAGVGTGQDLPAVFSTAPAQVEAIDVSTKMLDIARAKYPDAIFHHGNLATFGELQRKTYDVIVCAGVLEFCRDWAAVLRRCASLLSDRGSIILTFEPVIEGFGSQAEPMSVLHTDEVIGIDIFGLRIHRIGLQDFLDQVREAGLRSTLLDTFVAFVRGEERVIYNMAVLQKLSVQTRLHDTLNEVNDGYRP